jgi:hypothetical protein
MFCTFKFNFDGAILAFWLLELNLAEFSQSSGHPVACAIKVL